MINQELSEIFNTIADALEFKGENPFKINAYRKASRILKDFSENLREFSEDHPLTCISGIGDGIAKKIKEYIATGKVSKLEEVRKDIPAGIFEMVRIQYLGPKTLKLAYEKLGVGSLKQLKKVINDGSLSRIPGMGPRKVERIMDAIHLSETTQMKNKRFVIGELFPVIEEIVSKLKNVADEVVPCGSYRRMKETLGDINLLATSNQKKKVIDFFVSLQNIDEVLNVGPTKAIVLLKNPSLQVDLRVVNPDSFGASLQYFTGSKAHNVALRTIAKSRGLKINEYGVYKTNRKVAGKTEESIYSSIGLEFIPPEIREDTGEIELAKEHALPKIIDYRDFKGDLHIHSNYSDGIEGIAELANHAKKMGFKYIAICDHSRSVTYAGGLSKDKLLEKNEEIDRLNKKLKNFTVLKGTEVDILSSGRLDYPDSILETLDIVIAAIHQGFRRNVTARLIDAMNNPLVNIIAHPTGRLINKRNGYDVDLDKVFEQAQKTGTILEINAYYERLDLNDRHANKAKSMGIHFSIGTDAHNIGMLKYWKLGVGIARRAWLEKNDVINCYPLRKLKAIL